MGVPITLLGRQRGMRCGRRPSVGQDNALVYGEWLGYGAAGVEQLRGDGHHLTTMTRRHCELGRRFDVTSCVSWPSVPVEIVRAAGFRAGRWPEEPADPTPAADAHLEPGIFPSRLRQLVEDALTGRLSQCGAHRHPAHVGRGLQVLSLSA